MLGGLVVYAALVIGSAGLVVSGLSSVQSGFDRYEERTVIADRPTSSPDSLALGKTAIAGTARPDHRLDRLPFGGRERALVYELTVEDTNKIESPHVNVRIAPPFVLERDTEGADDYHVRVDASSLRLDLSDDRQWSTEIASHEHLPPDLADFAAANDLPSQGMERDRKFAYEYLAPDDEVFVYGRAVPDEERTDSREGKTVLVTADENGNGFLSDKSPDALLEERQRALTRHVSVGVVKATIGLAAFLWLTGIAQFVLGA